MSDETTPIRTTRLTDQLLVVFREEGEKALQAGEEYRARVQPLVERAAGIAAKVAAGQVLGQDTRELEADLRAIYLNIRTAGAIVVADQVRERFVAIARRGMVALFAALA